MTRLTSIQEHYTASNDIAAGTAEQYRFAAASLIRFIGRDPRIMHITAAVLNDWIATQLAAGYSRCYVKNQRGAILTLLRFARRGGHIKTVPDLVRPVRILPSIPEAFTLAEIVSALSFCRTIAGEFPNGPRRGSLLFALVLVAYYSGLRPCDLLRVRLKTALTEVWAIRQQKTGEPYYFSPPHECRQAIAATVRERRELLFPITKKALWYWWRKIEQAIGRRSSPKWLRRSGATQSEIANPGSAQAYLGQKTPGLAWRHYIDRTQIQQRKPLPPSPFGDVSPTEL